VCEAAVEVLAGMAVSTPDAAAGQLALGGLDQPRELVKVAREAVLQPVRLAAVARLSSPHALSTIARTAECAETRRAALLRIADGVTLLEVAQKSEHKDVALLAVERIDDPEALRSVATRGRNKAAARRARARIEEHERANRKAEPAPEPSAPVDAAPEAPAEVLVPEPAPTEAAPSTPDAAAKTATAEAAPPEAAPPEAAPAEPAPAEPAPAEAVPAEEAAAPPAEPAPETEAERDARRAEAEALCASYEAATALESLKAARQRVAELDKAWSVLRRAGAIGDELTLRRGAAEKQLQARLSADREARETAAAENKERLLTLCQKVESLVAVAEPSLREAERALRESRTALSQPGHLASKREADEILARLKAGRALLYGKVQEQKETDEWKRWANLGIQEELCQRAEALLEVTDLPRAARELRELDEKWKQASQVPRDQAESLWTRFKTARDPVRARCDAFFAAEALEREGNLQRKQALCAEAETLSDSTDWVKTAERLQALQAEWQTIGPVPRQHARPLWDRFRGACNKFFVRRKDDRATRAGERAKNLERKEALCVQAETLAESTEWEQGAAELKRLQAEWKTIGPVRKDRSEAVWQRFRGACDHFFERYKTRHDVEAQARVAAREAACSALEALVPGAEASSETPIAPPADLLDQVKAAQGAWGALAPMAGPRGVELDRRFQATVRRLVEAFPQAFAGSDLDPESNRRRMEGLCESVEGLVQDAPGSPAASSPAVLLAQQLREALASNTMRGRTEEAPVKRGLKDKVEAAQAAWKKLPPVPGEAGRLLSERFQKACRRALATP
jgi:hypothetical protein